MTSRLLIDFHRIGDLIMMVPFLRRLAEDAHLDLLTRPFGPSLFSGQSFIRNAIPLAHPNRGRQGLARVFLSGHRRRLGRQLASHAYDEILILEEERPIIRDWVEGWRGRSRLRVVDFSHGQRERLSRALTSLSMPILGDPVPHLEVPQNERVDGARRVGSLGQHVVAVQVGSNPASLPWPRRTNVKGLPTESWVALLSQILDEERVDGLVFVGVAAERRYVRPIVEGMPERHRARVHDWTDKTSLVELRAILAACEALVSVDTGTAHLAAAVGCPLLVSFGPADPAHYAPRGPGPVEVLVGSAPCQFCSGTRAFKTCRDNICMQSLTEVQLMSGWQRLSKALRDASP